jgi:hypothetical protein
MLLNVRKFWSSLAQSKLFPNVVVGSSRIFLSSAGLSSEELKTDVQQTKVKENMLINANIINKYFLV